MTTPTEISEVSPASTETADEARYQYGWRYVIHTLPDGEEKIERVPLTLEDILHPQIGDFRVHSQDHERFCVYLHNVFEARVAADPHAVVLHDVRVAWADPEVKPHGPDIAVIFGVREKQNWSTFDEKEEGTKPSLIIEVTSPNTRSVDLIRKFDQYDQVGVPLYIIIDSYQRQGRTTRRLLGYQLTPTGYTVLPPDERGWLWLEPVQVWLGLHENEPLCYDEAGQPIKDYTNLTAAYLQAETKAAEAESRATEAEARAKSEAEARSKAEARLQALENELRRLRGEGD